MKAPRFWRADGILSRLLIPFSFLWRAGAWLRRRRAGLRLGVPVICCGGVTVGGAGKTTVALDIIRRLSVRGFAVHCVTRGYGGRAAGPLRVDPAMHDADLVGDEALLLAEAAPVWVARDRAAGAQMAVASGAQVIVLDDGLQNPALAQDYPLLVIDGASGFGNGRVMPAGPLREPLARAAARARVAVLIGADRQNAASRLPAGLTVLRAVLRSSEPLQGVRVFALAGIAFPEKFHASLAQAGAILAGHADFSDHHPFTAREIETVLRQAEELDARPVTTPKDMVRIPPDLRDRFQAVGVALVWTDPAEIETLLSAVMEGA